MLIMYLYLFDPSVSKVLIGMVFAVMVTAVYLSPLLIQHHTPCLVHPEQIPPKPKLIGHRGAPMVSVVSLSLSLSVFPWLSLSLSLPSFHWYRMNP